MNLKDLFKTRSVTGCMKASYDTINSHILSIIKKTWWATLPFSILAAIVLYFLLPNKALHDWGIMNPWASFILQTVVYALFIIFAIVVSAAKWSWVNGEKFTHNISPRTIGKFICTVFKSGFRHFWGYFKTCFLGGIIIAIVTAIVCLPGIVLIVAQLFSQLGALEGDPLGVPGYFTPLLFLVFTAISFILCHVVAWLQITLVYQYGSYMKQEEEKQAIMTANELAPVNKI